MEIVCTLSEYTKMARKCGENKVNFNCNKCPFYEFFDTVNGEQCDIERFVRAVKIPEIKTEEDREHVPFPY